MDVSSARLLRDGVELNLRPQAFHALNALIQNTCRYVGYEQMIRDAWVGNVASRHTVAVTVGEAKKVLKEYGSWIHYRPKLGYRVEVPHSEDLIRKGWHFAQRYAKGLKKHSNAFTGLRWTIARNSGRWKECRFHTSCWEPPGCSRARDVSTIPRCAPPRRGVEGPDSGIAGGSRARFTHLRKTVRGGGGRVAPSAAGRTQASGGLWASHHGVRHQRPFR